MTMQRSPAPTRLSTPAYVFGVRRQSEAAAFWIAVKSKAVSRYACHRTPKSSADPELPAIARSIGNDVLRSRALEYVPGLQQCFVELDQSLFGQ